MIKIKKSKSPKQLSDTNKRFLSCIKGMRREDAYRFYIENEKSYKYNTDETKKKYREINYERCSFCTKYISDFNSEMTVEHIRTKKDFPRDIFRWSNMLCSCRTCNTMRSIYKYDKEKYLDPRTVENIEDYFVFSLDGRVYPNKALEKEMQAKAKYMIDLYKLNRHDLEIKRKEFLKDLMEDDDYNEILSKKDYSSQNIIFLSVFTYYNRSK